MIDIKIVIKFALKQNYLPSYKANIDLSSHNVSLKYCLLMFKYEVHNCAGKFECPKIALASMDLSCHKVHLTLSAR